MEANDITIRPARQKVRISDKCVFWYGTKARKGHHSIRLTQVLRAPVAHTTTLWPGEYIEVKLPDNMTSPDEYNTFSLEPTSCQSSTTNWPPPSFIDSVAGKVRIANLSNDLCTIERNQHLCLARPTFSPDVLHMKALHLTLSSTLKTAKDQPHIMLQSTLTLIIPFLPK